MTGKPHLNAVLRTHLAHTDKAAIDATIEHMISYFRARQLSFGWSVGPSMRPVDLGIYLQDHGFVAADVSDGLAVNIVSIPTNVSLPDSMVITEIEDPATMKVKAHIEQTGFEMPKEKAQNYYESYLAAGFGTGKNWHHYLGWLHGEAVAIASLLLHAGVAGIYGVATKPEARKQGLGTAMTYHVLHEAEILGYHVACLTDTDMSRDIYRRMGFQSYCKIHHYGWFPKNKE